MRQMLRDHIRAVKFQWQRRPGADWPGASRGMDDTYVPPVHRIARRLLGP